MIAYSYPGEKSVHFLSGEWRKNQEDQNGFVLAPFLKSEDSYTLLDSLPISSKLFF